MRQLQGTTASPVIDCDSDRSAGHDFGSQSIPIALAAIRLTGKGTTAPTMTTAASAPIDCSRDLVIARTRVGRWPYALVFDSNGDKVYCCAQKRDSVYVISGITDSGVIARVPVGQAPVALALSPEFNKGLLLQRGAAKHAHRD